MRTIKLIFTFGLITMFVWSCSDSTSVNNNGWHTTYRPYAAAKKVAPADSSISLAQNIPGFGGWFINKSGKLAIYLTHPKQQKAKAITVLSNSEFVEKALSNTTASVSNMVIKKGAYTFTELYNWLSTIHDKILPMEGFYTTGIDQSQNTLSAGVKNKTIRDRVINKLAELNIQKTQ